MIVAGVCAIEPSTSLEAAAGKVSSCALKYGLNFVIKASCRKENRTSTHSYRGCDTLRGLSRLFSISEKYSLPVTTDIHESGDAKLVSPFVDVIQIPALLSRQTPLLEAAGRTGLPVNIKKGQFMPPAAMEHAVEKVRSTGNDRVFITERGTTFGHGDLVVDFRGMVDMREFAPVIFDATHSVQRPSNGTKTSGGDWKYTIHLARAAAAMGVDGIFFETHPDPDNALCDGDIAWPLDRIQELIEAILDAWRPPEPKDWTMPIIGQENRDTQRKPHAGDGIINPDNVVPWPRKEKGSL